MRLPRLSIFAMLLPIGNYKLTDMNSGVEIGKRRINFTAATREILYKAAGGRCCFRTCLCLTEGVTEDRDGEAVVRGISVAAHVYSARAGGPRGQGGRTFEEIRDRSNGMWMCATHGREVDDFQDRYSAEHLLRMKAVRELAHELERQNGWIGFYVRECGVRDWNECVWENAAGTEVDLIAGIDTQAMVDAFMSRAIQKMALFDRHVDSLPPRLPAGFSLKPIVSAVSSLARPASVPEDPAWIVERPTGGAVVSEYERERRRAIEIAKAWLEEEGACSPAMTGLTSISEVLLGARDPVSGQILAGGIWQRADIRCRLSYSHEEGEVVGIESLHSFDDVSAFDWRLTVEIKHGTHSIKSRLRASPLRTPYLRSPFDRDKFHRYHGLLAKIAAGWEPIGYLSRLVHGAGMNSISELFAEPFEIDLYIGPEALRKLGRDCDKVLAGLEVARKWGEHLGFEQPVHTEFLFDEVFFVDSVEPELIRFAGDELMAAYTRERQDPRAWKTGPLFMTNPRSGVRFAYRRGTLVFERALYADPQEAP